MIFIREYLLFFGARCPGSPIFIIPRCGWDTMSRNCFYPKIPQQFCYGKNKSRGWALTPARGGFDKGNQTFTWQC